MNRDYTTKLLEELATRDRYTGFYDVIGWLPDPDPILRAAGIDIQTYRELLSDAHVWACWSSRKSGTSSRPWAVAQAGRGGTETANKAAYELCSDMMTGLPVRKIITEMLDTAGYGISPVEIIWEKGARWLPKTLTGKPPEWFAFDKDCNLLFKSIEAPMGELVPPEKFLLCQHNADYLNPYGQRVLAKCFWPVAFKKGGYRFWALAAEKYGIPWITGKVPRNTTQPERDKLLSRLVSMVQDAVAVINDDESVDLGNGSGKINEGLFERLIIVSNREISKAILNQTLSTELESGGSYAATQGHLEVRTDVILDDSEMVCAAFNQLFRIVTALNIPNAAPPVFKFQEDEDLQKGRSERDNNLKSQGVRFTKKYYMRAYNLEEDDIEVDESPAGTGGPAFAEGSDPAQEGLKTAQQIADDAAEATQAVMDKLLEPLLDMIEGAGSFAEIGEALYDLYPKMTSDQFQQLLERAMFASALTGAAAVEDENQV